MAILSPLQQQFVPNFSAGNLLAGAGQRIGELANTAMYGSSGAAPTPATVDVPSIQQATPSQLTGAVSAPLAAAPAAQAPAVDPYAAYLADNTPTRNTSTTTTAPQTSTTTKQLGPAYNTALAASTQAAGQQAQATEAAGAAQAQGHADKAALIDQNVAAQQTQLTQDQKDVAAQNDRLNALQSDIQAKSDEYKEAAAKLADPSSIQSTGVKITNTIAMIMGSLGALLQKRGNGPAGDNPVPGIINANIEREYRTLKDGVAAKKDSVMLSQKIFDDTKAQFADARAQKLAFSGQLQAIHAQQIDAATEKATSEFAKQQGIAASAALKKESANNFMQAIALEAPTQTTTSGGQSRTVTTQQQSPADKLKTVQAIRAGELDYKVKADKYAQEAGTTEQWRSEEPKLAKSVGNLASAQDAVARIKALDAKLTGPTSFGLTDADRTAMEVERKKFAQTASFAIAGQSMTDEMKKDMESLSSAGWTDKTSAAKLDAVLRAQSAEVANQLKTAPAPIQQRLLKMAGSNFGPQLMQSLRGGPQGMEALGGRPVE